MQILKDHVRKAILFSAREEFLKNGFSGATMRSISYGAKMTVGNLYRYYDSKLELFQAVLNDSDNTREGKILKLSQNGVLWVLNKLPEEELNRLLLVNDQR